MQPFTYSRPSTVPEAVQAVAAGGSGTRFLAGGTTLYDLMKLNVEAPTQVVDVTALSELAGFDTSGGEELVFGALARMSDVGQEPAAFDALRRGDFAIAGPAFPEFTTMSYIAHFVEVRVEPRTRRIRVPRVVSIADCGRVITPRTAASQVRSGVVWAFGAALREGTEVDPRYGGFLNNDLADYVVPVNADIGDIEVGFIDQPDPLANTIGLKSLGEVAMVGAAAAIANAIFHATGKRLRDLPIRIEHLL